MSVFRSDVEKIINGLCIEEKTLRKDLHNRLIQGKPLRKHVFHGFDEAKALICLLYLSRLPLSTLLNLRSGDFIVKKKKLHVLHGLNTIISFEDEQDVLVKTLWDYLRRLAPNRLVFKSIRSHPSKYYLLRRWFMFSNKNISLIDFR